MSGHHRMEHDAAALIVMSIKTSVASGYFKDNVEKKCKA